MRITISSPSNNLIDDLIKRNFNRDTIYNYFKVANSFDEFKSIIESLNK